MNTRDIIGLIIVLFLLTKVNSIFGAVGDFFTGGEDDLSEGSSHTNAPNPNKLSYALNEYKKIADGIYTSVWGSLGGLVEADEAIKNFLVLMQNDTDFDRLSYDYKIRGIWPQKYNLTDTINRYLDNDMKEAVNSDYASKGMNTRFY